MKEKSIWNISIETWDPESAQELIKFLKSKGIKASLNEWYHNIKIEG